MGKKQRRKKNSSKKNKKQNAANNQISHKLHSFFKRDDCIAIILIVILVPFLTIHSFRLKKEMHDESILLKAEVVGKYYHNPSIRYKPEWSFRFKYELDGQVFSKSNRISEKQYNSINIGDTIEVLVSLKHPNRHAFWTEAKGYLVLPSQTDLNRIPRKP